MILVTVLWLIDYADAGGGSAALTENEVTNRNSKVHGGIYIDS
jgi:hypothetical protein